jgi:hypothetical protein
MATMKVRFTSALDGESTILGRTKSGFSVGFDVHPGLGAELHYHRFALIVENGSPAANAWNRQLAFGMGPTGLVRVSGQRSRNAFNFADLFEIVRAARAADPTSAAAVRTFLAHLDPQILKAIRRAHSANSTTYNWCLVDPCRRVAAINAYPALIDNLMRTPCETAIALSGSLEHALSIEFDATPGLIRHVSKMAPTAIGKQTQETFNLLSRTPNDLWPRTKSQLDRIRDADNLIRSMLEDSWRVNAVSTVNTIATLRAKDTSWAENDGSTARDISDAVHSLTVSLLLPLIIGHGEPVKPTAAENLSRSARSALATANAVRRALKITLMGEGGAPALLRFSKAWHERIQILSREASELPAETKLPRLAAAGKEIGTVALDGVSYAPITTIAGLRQESEEMQHCIQTYDSSAIKSHIFAYSCSGAHGRFTTTISRTDKGALSLDDARDDRNKPNETISASARRLLEHLVGLEAEPVGGEDAQKLLTRKGGPKAWIEDPSIPLAFYLENFHRWMAVLPARLRAPDPESFRFSPLAEIVRAAIISKAKAPAKQRLAA